MMPPRADDETGVGGQSSPPSDKVKTEKALRDELDLLQEALDSAGLGTWNIDPTTGRFTCDTRFREIFGHSVEGKNEQEALSTLHPDDLPAIQEKVTAATRLVDPQPYDVEYRVIHPDGSIHWVLAKGSARFEGTGPKKTLVSFAGTVADITARKKIEHELKDTQSRLSSILDAAEVATWTWDLATDQIVADRNLARLFSINPDEAPGTSFEKYLDRIHPEDRQRVRDVLMTSLQREGLYDIDYRVVQTDGSIRWLTARGKVERDAAGQAVRFPGLVLDITPRKLAEEALAKARRDLEQANQNLEATVVTRTQALRETIEELEAFSYSISHDLRAPLRAMQGYASVLLEEGVSVSAQHRDYLERINRASQRLDQLINDILRYSRLTRAEVALTKVDLNVLVRDIINEYPQLHDQLATITIEPLPVVFSHEVLLSQCLSNLLTNAVKFTAPGVRPAVKIWAEERGAAVRLWMEDNGIGVEPKDLARIFGMFERVSPDQKYEGTGIGLAIVKRALDRLGGKVGVSSQIGEGSQFWIELPKSPPGSA